MHAGIPAAVAARIDRLFLRAPIRLADRVFGDLYLTQKRSGGEFIADVYIAEATSTHDAYSSIQKSRDGSDYLYLISRQFEMAWFNTSDARHLKVLIRFDRFLIQISGEANAVEALSNAFATAATDS